MCTVKITISIGMMAISLAICAAIPQWASAKPKAPTEEQQQFLKSFIPNVPIPKPTEQQTQQGFIPYWVDPTSNFYSNIPPTSDNLKRQPFIRTPAGEDEPLLLGVWGLRPMHYASVWVRSTVLDTTVRVIPDHGDRDLMSLGKLGIPFFLEPDRELKVQAGRNVFFWINIHVPKGTKPGKYQGELLLTVSEFPSSELEKEHKFGHRVKLPFTVDVLPFVLPHAEIAFGMYFPAQKTNLPKEHLTDEMMMGYYRDMARHGQTSATLYIYEALHDGEGRPTLDGKETTKKIEMMRKASKKVDPQFPRASAYNVIVI